MPSLLELLGLASLSSIYIPLADTGLLPFLRPPARHTQFAESRLQGIRVFGLPQNNNLQFKR